MVDHIEKQLILIVDDTPDNIHLLAGILREEYEIKAAINGKKALQIASTDPKPDIILLDIMMPDLDGYEVCRLLKGDPKTSDIPIIFITAKDDVADEKLGFEVGAVDYITKPISPPIVTARVKNHLLLKKQQDQLKESVSLLEHEAEILQQKAELGLQASGLAHDINNVLAIAMGVEIMPDLLPDNFPEKETVNDYVNTIMENLLLGREVCQGFTSYLRDIGSEAREQPLLPLLQPIDMYSRKFRGSLVRDFAEDLPPIYCKGYQIKRVLINLLSNAIQAVESQEEQKVTVKVWSNEQSVFFSITDNGPGISQEVLPKIYKEFFTTKGRGTGLGLFMVKEIVNSHNGKIEVETNPEKGTSFVVSFPIFK